MPTLTFRSPMPVSAEALFAWHARPGAFERLTPPWNDVTLEAFEGIREGQRAVIRLGLGPLRIRWVAEHFGYEEGRQFQDRQVKGPFGAWEHTHRMEPDPAAPETRSTLVDHIEYALPLGRLGAFFGGGKAQRDLSAMFAYRHRITANDLGLHQRYNPEGRRLRIAVSGASGMIGSSLVAFLTTGGHEVVRMVRRRPTAADEIYWNHREHEIEAEKLEGLDAVIHLAGESVFALRWTQEKKARILRSREAGTKLLSTTLAHLKAPPSVFLSASGVGYYGNRGAEVLTETSAPGKQGFLTAVSHDWEAATRPAADAGIRTVPLRLGVVLSPRGGALAKMLPAFRLGLGGPVGHKDQYLSWIALDDVLGGIYHALFSDLGGPLNLTAPEPVTMADFARTLAGVLRRPAFLHVPPFALRLAAGQVADEVLLTSARVLPQRLQQSRYSFLFSDLEAALKHQLGALS